MVWGVVVWVGFSVGSCGGRQFQFVAVAVWGGCAVGMMQCGGVVVGGNKVWGICSMEEQCC